MSESKKNRSELRHKMKNSIVKVHLFCAYFLGKTTLTDLKKVCVCPTGKGGAQPIEFFKHLFVPFISTRL